MAKDAALAVAYDKKWLDLWRARFEEPLDDAESQKIGDDGRIIEIGRNVRSLSEIEGQYLGLLRLTPEAMKWIRNLTSAEEGLASRLDMTSLLNRLILAGRRISGVSTSGNWCEIDTPHDLVVAEKLVAGGKLHNPFTSQYET